MEQLLIHLFGDYVTQTDWMAREKTKSHLPALIHAVIYTLPFLFLTTSLAALAVIVISHFFIDRYRLATRLVFAKNWVTDRSMLWKNSWRTGFSEVTPATRTPVPPWMAFWLLIIVDNTIHLCINYACLKWL